MKVRHFKSSDAVPLAELFYTTIHTINAKDYSQAQLHAWAPPLDSWDMEKWKKSFHNKFVYIIENHHGPVGFGELEQDGHIDRFYIHKDYIGHGLGSLIYVQLEAKALELGISRIFVEASITAKPFFQKKGFRIVKEQTVIRDKIELNNFIMEKLI